MSTLYLPNRDSLPIRDTSDKHLPRLIYKALRQHIAFLIYGKKNACAGMSLSFSRNSLGFWIRTSDRLVLIQSCKDHKEAVAEHQ